MCTQQTKILLHSAAFYSCCIWPRELRQQVKWMFPTTGGPPRPKQPKDFIDTSYPLLSSLILNPRGALPLHTHTHPHTPTLRASLFGFRPPNSARIGYATEGTLLISAQLHVHRRCQRLPNGLDANKTLEAT